jgi:hypothetical protein
MNRQEQPLTPNEELATIITDALAEAGLISDPRQDELRKKLADGSVRQEDWRLWLEVEPGDRIGGGNG